MIKLSADETEQLTRAKVKAHAQVSGISGGELKVCLETLKAFQLPLVKRVMEDVLVAEIVRLIAESKVVIPVFVTPGHSSA